MIPQEEEDILKINTLSRVTPHTKHEYSVDLRKWAFKKC
jgi:hypothetical protein